MEVNHKGNVRNSPELYQRRRQMKGKRVAVTGGAGFIGSNLAEELATGNSVIIIDDLSTGMRGNIVGLIEKENVRFIQGSILDLSLLQECFRGVDFVFHQAALPSVPRLITSKDWEKRIPNRRSRTIFFMSSAISNRLPGGRVCHSATELKIGAGR